MDHVSAMWEEAHESFPRHIRQKHPALLLEMPDGNHREYPNNARALETRARIETDSLPGSLFFFREGDDCHAKAPSQVRQAWVPDAHLGELLPGPQAKGSAKGIRCLALPVHRSPVWLAEATAGSAPG